MTNAVVNANFGLSTQFENENLIADWIRFCDVKPETQKTYLKSIKQFYLYLEP